VSKVAEVAGMVAAAAGRAAGRAERLDAGRVVEATPAAGMVAAAATGSCSHRSHSTSSGRTCRIEHTCGSNRRTPVSTLAELVVPQLQRTSRTYCRSSSRTHSLARTDGSKNSTRVPRLVGAAVTSGSLGRQSSYP